MAINLLILAVLAAVAVVAIKRPAVAVGAALTGFVFEQVGMAHSVYFADNKTVLNYAFGALLIWATLCRLMLGRPTFRPVPPVLWVVVSLYALGVLSWFWSIYPQRIEEVLPKLSREFVVFFFLVYLGIATLKDLKTALWTVIGFAFVELLILTLATEWSDRRGVVLATNQPDEFGRLQTANPLAVASVAGWLALLVLLMNFSRFGKAMQIFRWGAVLLAVATVVWTDTRGQLFAAVIAGIVLLPLSRRMTNWKGFVGTGVTVVLLLGAASVLVDVIVGEESRWSGETMTETWQASRLETSKIVLEAWADGGPVRWVVGLGYEASFAPSLLGAYPHLVMLQALAEQGIIGFVLLWLVVLLAARSVVRLWPRVTDDPNQRGLIAGLAALFLFEVILSFKQGSTLAFYNAYAFAVILGRLEMTVPEPAHAEPDAAESAHGSDEAWDDDPCDPDGLPGDAEGYDDYALPDRRPVHAGSAF